MTQSRGLGRLLGDHLLERPDLVAAAPGLDIKISGCPNGCGQHHIAGARVPGQPAQGRRPAGAALLRDGRRRRRRRIDDVRPPGGQVPARRGRRRAGAAAAACIRRSAPPTSRRSAFFRRVELARSKAALADLEQLAPSRPPQDFIDLAEVHAFRPEVRKANAARERHARHTMSMPSLRRLGRRYHRPHVAAAAAAAGRRSRRGTSRSTPRPSSSNPGGSVKDRAAAAILRRAERSGRLRPGAVILDATSGNTGIAYAMLAAAHGYKLKLCVPGERHHRAAADAARLRRRAGDHQPDGRHRRRDPRSAPAARSRVRTATSTPTSTTTTPTGAPTTRPPRSRSSSRPTAASRTSSPASAPAAPSSAPAAACASSTATSS